MRDVTLDEWQTLLDEDEDAGLSQSSINNNALLIKAHMPELPVAVDAACCAGVTPRKHRAALDTLESCQILVKNRGEAGQEA